MKNRWFWLTQADDFTTILLDCKIVYNCDRSGQSSKCDDEPYANSTIYKMHLQFKADIALKNSRQTCRLTGRKKKCSHNAVILSNNACNFVAMKQWNLGFAIVEKKTKMQLFYPHLTNTAILKV